MSVEGTVKRLLVALVAACGPQTKVTKPTPASVVEKFGGPAKLDQVRPSAASNAKPAPILATMSTELARSMSVLKKHSDPPYFAAYEVTDMHTYDIRASFGVLENSAEDRGRYLDVEVRVGDYKLDNTHQV